VRTVLHIENHCFGCSCWRKSTSETDIFNWVWVASQMIIVFQILDHEIIWKTRSKENK